MHNTGILKNSSNTRQGIAGVCSSDCGRRLLPYISFRCDDTAPESRALRLEDVAATIESEPGDGFLLIVTIPPHGVEAKA
ncbi:hypothetical protein [Cupriavidus sp. BIS7]|uniref:hypothetical protein n=1 Tax=Cupriavidus sp. BIS7 TaxID=1217718 RepID=UPI0012F6AE0F|nr:hypothetical protein [Cupriavidus sp. BIS7]